MSNQSDSSPPAAAAESERDKPKTSEKESSQINRGFQEPWLRLFPWLVYDKEDNIMRCSLCVKHKKKKLCCPQIFSIVPNILEGRGPWAPKLKFLA